MDVDIIAKGLFLWMFFISTLVGIMLTSTTSPFYRFGPQEDLTVMGVDINTPTRYTAVVVFCVMNSFIRSLETDVVHAWLINTVQDKTVPKTHEVRRIAYQVSIVHSMYFWWDWFIYMNVLLAQFDLFMFEMSSSILTSVITTHMYLKSEPSFEQLI